MKSSLYSPSEPLLSRFFEIMKTAATAAMVVPNITPATAGCPSRQSVVATAVSITTTNMANHWPRRTCDTLLRQILSSCSCRCLCSISAIVNMRSAEPGSISSYPRKISGWGIGPLNDSSRTEIRLTTRERSSDDNCSKDFNTLSAVGRLSACAGFIGGEVYVLRNEYRPRPLPNRKLSLPYRTVGQQGRKGAARANRLSRRHPRQNRHLNDASSAVNGF